MVLGATLTNPAIGAAIAIGGAFVADAGYLTFTGIGANTVVKGAKEMSSAAREYNKEKEERGWTETGNTEERSVIERVSDATSKLAGNAKSYVNDFRDFRNSRRK